MQITCPNCEAQNASWRVRCKSCGEVLLVESEVKGSSLKRGTSEVSGLTIVLIVLSLILVVAGFFYTSNAITQSATFAAAAVFAILARIAKAGRQHAELMDELRSR